ncbi:hypothetical protein ACFZAR_32485 [Streptomyces sp. NPDC008222]|uniref:hypothetical protein n=1 Tax=Streptomyces sp. NPDC008222 TaxID=3364820 RepID=UPI0036E65F71
MNNATVVQGVVTNRWTESAGRPSGIEEGPEAAEAGLDNEIRTVFAGNPRPVPVRLSGTATEQEVVTGDGTSVKISIQRPETSQGGLPAVLFADGNVWIVDDLQEALSPRGKHRAHTAVR